MTKATSDSKSGDVIPFDIPQWQRESEYPSVGCKDLSHLVWEFVKRHPQYPAHAEQMLRLVETGEYTKGIKRKSESVLDGVECWPPANPRETAKDFFRRTKQEKIKYARIDKPHNTFANRWGMEKPVTPTAPFDPATVKFINQKIKLKRHEKFLTRSFNLFIYPNEVGVRFRLDMSINKQINLVQKQLEAEAKSYAQTRGALSGDEKQAWADLKNFEVDVAALANAHYWLRCYDAKKQPKKALSNEPRLRRALRSGPKQQVEQFNAEKKAKNLGNFVSTGTLKGYLSQAVDYIDHKKFLLLLAPALKL